MTPKLLEHFIRYSDRLGILPDKVKMLYSDQDPRLVINKKNLAIAIRNGFTPSYYYVLLYDAGDPHRENALSFPNLFRTVRHIHTLLHLEDL